MIETEEEGDTLGIFKETMTRDSVPLIPIAAPKGEERTSVEDVPLGISTNECFASIEHNVVPAYLAGEGKVTN